MITHYIMHNAFRPELGVAHCLAESVFLFTFDRKKMWVEFCRLYEEGGTNESDI